MICKQCGAQIEDNAAECKFCGLKYDENEVVESEETIAETEIEAEEEENEELIAEEEEASDLESEDAEIDELMDENEAKRKKQFERLSVEKQNQLKEIEKRRKVKQFRQKRNKVLIAVLIIAIIAAIGGGGYMLWKDNDEKPSIIIPTAEPTVSPTVTPEVVPSPSPEVSVEPSQNLEVEESEQPSIRPISPSEVSDASQVQSVPNGSDSSQPNSGASSTGASAPKQTARPNIRPIETQKPAATEKPQVAVEPTQSVNTPVSVSGVQPSTSNVSFGGKEYNADGGYADGKFTSALITGVEVMNGPGKTYMAFKFNGASYYANVSPSTTTYFVSGRPMTISAYKTSEIYNGSPVYEITAITNYTGKNILPNSGFELLTEADVAGLSPAELRLARNEIYARHGRSFKDAELRKYFEGCSWYKVKKSYNYSNEAANLNSIEKANINFILKHER